MIKGPNIISRSSYSGLISSSCGFSTISSKHIVLNVLKPLGLKKFAAFLCQVSSPLPKFCIVVIISNYKLNKLRYSFEKVYLSSLHQVSNALLIPTNIPIVCHLS